MLIFQWFYGILSENLEQPNSGECHCGCADAPRLQPASISVRPGFLSSWGRTRGTPPSYLPSCAPSLCWLQSTCSRRERPFQASSGVATWRRATFELALRNVKDCDGKKCVTDVKRSQRGGLSGHLGLSLRWQFLSFRVTGRNTWPHPAAHP